ncbi:MAG: PfkB family carbohydrate kinase [Erysipelotrichaceae bacterium]
MGWFIAIGTAMIDTVLLSPTPFEIGRCTKSTRYPADGGAVRNIAHNLALLGNKVFFWAKFGNDSEALDLITRTETLGIQVHSTIVNAPTPHFYQLISNKQSMMASTITDDFYFNRNDLFPTFLLEGQEIGITDQDDPRFLTTLIQRTPKVKWIALGFLPPVELQSSFFAVFANKHEVLHTSDSIFTFFKNTSSIPLTCVTMDQDGLRFDYYGKSTYIEAPVLGSGNDIGMGDAMVAGFMHAMANGLSVELSLSFGVKCARKTSDATTAVNPDIIELEYPHP